MQKRTHISDEEENQESLKKARHDVSPSLSTSDALIVANSDLKDDKRTSDLQAPTMLLSGHNGAVYSISFDPTGKSLASSSFDGEICKFPSFFDLTTLTRFCSVLWNTFGECENYNVLSGHKNAVLEVHWESSGSKIISCSADKTVGLWDARKGARIRRLAAHTGIVNSCSVALDAPDLFSSGSDDCTAMIWDTRDKSPIQTIWHDYQVTSVCMDREGGHLYTGGIDNIIRRWDLRMPSTIPNLTLNGHGNTITGLSLNPEGTHLLSNGMDSNLFCEFPSLTLTLS
jgi:Prp8 binding protein